MTSLTKSINQAIRVNLTRRGMSQQQLSAQTGIGFDYISKHINGHRVWSIEDIDKIAKTFEMEGAAELLASAKDEQRLAA
ncbi:helix-turn-helix transcriptional regulator [Bifidobacterium sp. ESL0745]|uniref:helix-turn-helix domain-containing protein n=1 Tax=Bifidobacterium sp. ESL0745 TaxID=2983226 RepID=UPI0023F84F5A|nr:helix-turn-helix transcriptional regulator [Bifidobacterium sp. ESL0745]MDF7665693.1 helix-turn-helix transcriptional regulator [Bifidobacterium sp. ESL0745]